MGCYQLCIGFRGARLKRSRLVRPPTRVRSTFRLCYSIVVTYLNGKTGLKCDMGLCFVDCGSRACQCRGFENMAGAPIGDTGRTLRAK